MCGATCGATYDARCGAICGATTCNDSASGRVHASRRHRLSCGPASSRRRPAGGRRARVRPGPRPRARRRGQDQDAHRPRPAAHRTRHGPLGHPHARLQPQGRRAAGGTPRRVRRPDHAAPRLSRRGRQRPIVGRRGTGPPHSRPAARRPLRHLQRLRLPLPARGARGALLAGPDRRRAARPHAPGHGGLRHLPRGSEARPRQRPCGCLHGCADARARRARVTGGDRDQPRSRPASRPS